jgi:hypothetical protein
MYYILKYININLYKYTSESLPPIAPVEVSNNWSNFLDTAINRGGGEAPAQAAMNCTPV